MKKSITLITLLLFSTASPNVLQKIDADLQSAKSKLSQFNKKNDIIKTTKQIRDLRATAAKEQEAFEKATIREKRINTAWKAQLQYIKNAIAKQQHEAEKYYSKVSNKHDNIDKVYFDLKQTEIHYKNVSELMKLEKGIIRKFNLINNKIARMKRAYKVGKDEVLTKKGVLL